MTRDSNSLLAYRHVQGKIVHLYPDCPEGNLIAIAKRDAVHDLDDVWAAGLEWCEWCRFEREKEVGNGALIQVAGELEMSPREPERTEIGKARRRRIMLVDDDSGVRRAIGAILTRAGYDVLLAADGAEAVRRRRELKEGDLVILDLFMPEMDGLEAIVELRAHSPGVPIIAITGGGGTGRMDILQDAKQLGAVEGLEKPFTPNVLLALISRTIANVG